MYTHTFICMYTEREEKRDFKKLVHMIVAVGKSEIYRAHQEIGNTPSI